LHLSLQEGASFSSTLQAVAEVATPLKIQLRALLHYHCGVKMLKTRQMLHDLQALTGLDRL
jgi:DNA repair protein RecO (recombination protein O)